MTFVLLNLYFSCQPGKELTVPHQMSLAGAVSLPVFWLAGAGAAVFWVLGKPNHISCSGHSLLFWACRNICCSAHQGTVSLMCFLRYYCCIKEYSNAQ